MGFDAAAEAALLFWVCIGLRLLMRRCLFSLDTGYNANATYR
jgi:hypothetical protein